MGKNNQPLGLLKQRREDAGLTQRQLAEISGVSRRTIEHLETRDVGNARGYTLKKLSDALGIWMDCLLTDEHDED